MDQEIENMDCTVARLHCKQNY